MVNIIITDAGLAEIVNAENTGTAPVVLTEIGLGTGRYTAAANQTALKQQFKRLPAISGGDIGDNILHINMQDAGDDAYTVYELGVFTASGTLFAVVSQESPIIEKAGTSVANISVDIVLSNINPASVTVGDTDFVLNSATTEKQGIVELATEAEAKAGTDTHRAITPKTLDATIEGHDNIVHRSGAEAISGTKTFSVSPIAPTPAAGDNSTKIATTAWVTVKAKEYLPLAGGKMIGHIYKNTDNSFFMVSGGSGGNAGVQGASLLLYGKESSGNFALYAGNGTDTSILYATPSGSLVWKDKHIVRSVNNVNANAAGDVTISISNISGLQSALDGKLSLTGGTMTGQIKTSGEGGGIVNSSGNSGFVVYQDTNVNEPGTVQIRAGETSKNSYINLYSANHPQSSGRIVLYARNSDDLTTLTVDSSDGALINNVPVITAAGGQMTTTTAMSRNVANSFLGLHGGTGTNNDGAQLFLCGASHSTMPGAFQLTARNSSKAMTLQGDLDGVLTWNGKYVLNNSFLMPTDGGAIHLTAGTSATGGAYFRLYGKDHADGAGQFVLATTDGTNTNALVGKPDGSLTWMGKSLLTESAGLKMPNYAAGVEVSAVGNKYTMPIDGWVCFHANIFESWNAYINGVQIYRCHGSGDDWQGSAGFMPVSKGDVLTFDGDYENAQSKWVKVFPFK